MDHDLFLKQYLEDGEIFLKDDFLGVAVRYNNHGEKDEVFLKWRGREPVKVAYDNKTAFDIEMDKDSVGLPEMNTRTVKNPVERAIAIASAAHRGQKDKVGKPVILHPLQVGLAGVTDDERIVGFLHDVAEDTDVTLEDIRAQGFGGDVMDALELLTKPRGMDYDEYISRLVRSGNGLALKVKLNDLENNIKRGLDAGFIDTVEKHMKARLRIKKILEIF